MSPDGKERRVCSRRCGRYASRDLDMSFDLKFGTDVSRASKRGRQEGGTVGRRTTVLSWLEKATLSPCSLAWWRSRLEIVVNGGILVYC